MVLAIILVPGTSTIAEAFSPHTWDTPFLLSTGAVILWAQVCQLSNTFYFFFFKQKTAYEIRLSLVGSEMCIRDRPGAARVHRRTAPSSA